MVWLAGKTLHTVVPMLSNDMGTEDRASCFAGQSAMPRSARVPHVSHGRLSVAVRARTRKQALFDAFLAAKLIADWALIDLVPHKE